ncbi:uncharacterized protein [Apostichopus japonicus]|uniref:uncharacterized protein isoform X4 n=1 Tax=Stichopus japonicus TaxID=307972 RepID=UPI003AB3E943
MAASEVLVNQYSASQQRPRPLTFAEFGTDLKPYFTTYQDPERPLSFLELGLDVEKESSTFDTRVGKYRKWKGLSIAEKLFFTTSVIFLVTFLALTTNRLFFADKYSQDFTFVLLLLLNAAFCLYYVIHGIFREHGFELFVYAFSVGVVLIYCVENFFETEIGPVKLARLVVVGIFAPPEVAYAIYLGWHYQQSKNLIFRTVGANLYRQNLCVKMYMFVDLLKFDLQLERVYSWTKRGRQDRTNGEFAGRLRCSYLAYMELDRVLSCQIRETSVVIHIHRNWMATTNLRDIQIYRFLQVFYGVTFAISGVSKDHT